MKKVDSSTQTQGEQCPFCGSKHRDVRLRVGVWSAARGNHTELCSDPWHVAPWHVAAPSPLPQPPESRDVIYRLVDQLNWALDLMQMYERRLLEFGDPKELVHSAVHVGRTFQARSDLEYAWQMLNDNSRCHGCQSGSVPLNGWHKYAGGDEPCQNK